MNDDDATALLDRLTAKLPDPSTPVGLLAEGRRLTRRRRRTRLGAGLAAVVVAVAGVAVVPTLVGHGSASPPPAAPPDRPFPTPPPGMKWVGQGRVVVAVPVDWRVDDGPCSGGDASASVGAASSARCLAPTTPSGSRVEFGPDEMLGSEQLRCELSQPPTCSATTDAEGIRVRVTATTMDADAVVYSVLDSLMVLPDGWTTVPFAPNSRLSERIQVLEDAGFDVVVEDVDGITEGHVSVVPGLGSPIEEGGTVTLSLGGPPERQAMVANPSIAEPGQQIDLSFPGTGSRGIGFTAQAEDGTTYYLAVGSIRDPVSPWSTDVSTFVDVGVSGPGRIQVPDDATPGGYRLCTANTTPRMCTGITVTE